MQAFENLDDEAFRRLVRDWLAEELVQVSDRFPAPVSPHDMVFRRAWEDHLCAAGWSGLTWPRAYGGKALPIARMVIYLEEYARSGAPQGVNVIGHGILGPTLLHFGSEAQKQRFLPELLANREVWCQGYSEPGAGSDLAALRTRAVLKGDHYEVTGQKIWTSYAHIANWCFLLARTDPSAPKHKGISFLLVDMKTSGITVRPIRQMNGEQEFNEVFFDAVKVPVENRVGDENAGWAIAMAAASFERATYFIPRLVRMEEEFRDLLAVARARRPGVGVALDDPAIRERFAQSYLDVHVLKLFACRMLETMEGTPGPEGSYLKLFWSESHQRLLELAMDVLGPAARLGPQDPEAVDRRHWQRDYLWSCAETILAGTSEIQRNIIAERVVGLPR
ncbi:acyl-CoA dehydrogenase family protein [Xanthobacter oligotrophicus]|uniref:acyl-CoA dehydrogenase family protein n=1 Tax=Xanthobacter oligotrophicus TaxID=2607286 RepID=UPI0011F370CC|nr:acyl-CoA dehydrogenase family protein [Xanthobacter oligotrophicus]MCG5234351.1 acyl-CoA dehydrogenase family protein [Xanthobacter oligotrophicus]